MIDIRNVGNENSIRLLQLMEKPYHYTYILVRSDGTYYTGITKDISKRLHEHQSGKSKSTRNKLPVKLIYLKGNEDVKSSRQLEVHIKLRGAKRYIDKRVFKAQIMDESEWIDTTLFQEVQNKKR